MAAADGRGDGVGGRQGDPACGLDGGGYLDICTEQGLGFGDEPQVREFRAMGLPKVWMDAVRLLGPAKFLELWRLLDRPELIESEGRLRMTMPRFRQFLRFQRNRYIQALAHDGHGAQEIQARVHDELGERISVRHVQRLMKE